MKELLCLFISLFAVSITISLFISHIFFWIHIIDEKFVGRDTDQISVIIIGATLFLFPIFGMINVVLIVRELTLDYRIRKHNKKSTNFSNIPMPANLVPPSDYLKD
jgi:hypothetical protein